MTQWVKDLVLSLLQLRSLLWYRFYPWFWNFHMPWGTPPPQKKAGIKSGERVFSMIIELQKGGGNPPPPKKKAGIKSEKVKQNKTEECLK